MLKSRVAGLVCAAIAFAAPSAIARGLSSHQKQQVQELIAQTLHDQPKLVVDALVAFRKEQVAKQEQASQQKVSDNAGLVFATEGMPMLGNAKGSATAVEFIDYQCRHCRDMSETLNTVLAKDKELRVIVRELPIFGGNSVLAAKAALAANLQGKFAAMHKALFAADALAEKDILALATKIGLDSKRLKKDMHSDKVDAMLKDNFALAQKLGIMATPTFVLGTGTNGKHLFVPGAVPAERFHSLIKQVRNAKG